MKRKLTDAKIAELEVDLLERMRLDSEIAEVTDFALGCEYGVSRYVILDAERDDYGRRKKTLLTPDQVRAVQTKRKRYHELVAAREPYKLRNLKKKYGVSTQPIYTTLWALQKRLWQQRRRLPHKEAA